MSIDKLNELDDQVTGSNWDEYEAPSESSGPPESGVYTFMRVEEQEQDFKQGRSVMKDGVPFAWFNFKMQIQGGPADGRIAFGGCNTITSQFRKASSAADYIKACKNPARPNTFKEYETTIRNTFGPFNALMTWEWRCKDCEETFFKGQRNPKVPKRYAGDVKPVVARDAKGNVSPYQKCPICSTSVTANLVIVKFIVTAEASVAAPKAPVAPAAMAPAAG